VPKGYAHVPGDRLQPVCRKLRVKYAAALVGWQDRGRRYPARPVLDGVVVHASVAEKVRRAAADRAARSRPRLPEQRAADRDRRQERETARFAQVVRERFPGMPETEVLACARHATEIGSGRVGRSRVAEDPVYPAVVAHVRHEHTRYEELLFEGWDRDEARDAVREEVRRVIERWEESPAS
jgi:hypothetical protein